MTRKTWPLLLGSFVVSTVLIAACNSSTEDDEDDGNQTGNGGSSTSSTAKGGATQATGVSRGGSNSTQAATGRGGANIFSSITPAQGSTTARGGAASQGGAATRGGAAGNSNRGGNAGNAGRAGSSNKAGNAGMGGSGATAGTIGKGGTAGTPGDGGTSAIAGHAGTATTSTSSANAGSSGASNPSTGGASTGGVSTGGTSSSSVAGSAGAAGGPAVVTTCTYGCANVNIPFTAAGQTAEFSAVPATAVDITGDTIMSITVYSPTAISGDQIRLGTENGTGAKCSGAPQSLSLAASGYVTLTYSTSTCSVASKTGVIRAVVTVTSGDTEAQTLSVESISITDTSAGTLAWGLDSNSTISTAANDCYPSIFCAVSGTVTGALTWTAPGS